MRLPMEKLVQILILFALASIIACGPSKSDEFLNQEPTAVAPADFITSTGTSVLLDGSGSFDSDGTIVTYLWVQSSGSPTVTLLNANTASATFIAPDITSTIVLGFRLTVTDDFGKSDSDSVVVSVVLNQPPQAVVPVDFTANEFSTALLDGSASSDDIGIATYSWVQTTGAAVSIIDPNSALASFSAPEVAAGQTAVLSFDLTVTDAAGETSTDSITVTVVDVPGTVGLSGVLTFDKVPHTVSSALDYNNIIQAPIRGATIELLDGVTSIILQTNISAPNGSYLFGVPESATYVIRVKAKLKSQIWDFSVVDNTSGQALYAMDSATINIATTSLVINLNAPSGWDGADYTGARVAAPFAILDSVYQAKEKIISVDAGASMPALKLNWSIDNKAIGGDTSLGEISTSHYDGTEIFILGNANGDTDEYDGHVIIHEWGHYFEDKLSRSDSIGGNHGLGDKLDMRVALSEGFGNALSGMVTDDPFYRDSFGPSQSSGFDINVETNPTTNQGWFSEESVQSLLYDLYDSSDDGADNISLGFAPIYNALISGQKSTLALTSIFSLANQIKAKASINGTTFDTFFGSQNVNVSNDFGLGETNDGGNSNNLPIHKTINVGGGSVQICSSGANGEYNKLGNRQFIRFTINADGDYRFAAIGQNTGDDPDIAVYKSGAFIFSSTAIGNEFSNQTLTAGSYVMDVYEWANISGNLKDTCIDVTITAL